MRNVCKNGPKGAHEDKSTVLSVREFLATEQITLLKHPAYSPDLALNEFFLFLKKRKYGKEGILMTTSGVIQREL
jgi:hypothetical protein